MLSWLTGPHAGQAEGEAPDATFAEIPETPAHLFAVRAFKNALFGTPEPVTPFIPKLNGAKFQNTTATAPTVSSSTVPSNINSRPNNTRLVTQNRRIKSLQVQEDRKAKAQLFGIATDSAPASSPTKPPGILMTPGTAAGRRKQVTFGEKVVDNEGKKRNQSLSGLPDDYPGKFPSPFTPKVVNPAALASQIEEKVDTRDQSLDTKFKEALNSMANGRIVIGKSKKSSKAVPSSSSTSLPGTNVRSKDDTDITLDMSLPSSASGRYWKEQYETYSTRSEAELNRLIAKHRIAKDYARMKDEEVTTLKAQLDADRRKRQDRERGLESQIKDLRERLRLAMAENAKMSTELAALRVSSDDIDGELSGQRGAHKQNRRDGRNLAPELLIEGFKDVEIPIGTRKGSEPGKGRSENTKMESSGQDIWLDNDASADFRQPARRLVKSTAEAFTTTPRIRNSWSSTQAVPEAPLSSRAIREKLANSILTARSANIISKIPPQSTIEDPQDILKGIASVTAGTPSSAPSRGRSPKSIEKRSVGISSIGDKRKDSALARIEARRKNKRETKVMKRSSTQA